MSGTPFSSLSQLIVHAHGASGIFLPPLQWQGIRVSVAAPGGHPQYIVLKTRIPKSSNPPPHFGGVVVHGGYPRYDDWQNRQGNSLLYELERRRGIQDPTKGVNRRLIELLRSSPDTPIFHYYVKRDSVTDKQFYYWNGEWRIDPLVPVPVNTAPGRYSVRLTRHTPTQPQ